MLRALRVRFTAIVMALLALLLLAVLSSSYLATKRSFDQLVSRALASSLDTSFERADGSITQVSTDNDLPQVSTLVVEGTETPEDFTLYTDTSRSGVDHDTILRGVRYVLESGESRGTGRNGTISWMLRRHDGDFQIAFANQTGINAALREQALSDVLIFIVAMAALLLPVWQLSNWAFRPVEDARRLQDQFVADVSHELKTPLAVIMANLAILGRDDSSITPDDRAWLDKTDEAARRMQRLVNDMLVLARMEEVAEGGREDRSNPVNLSRIVERVALELEALAYERHVSIETDVTRGIRVRGASDELERLAITLIDNACKYASRDTVVRVTLTHSGNHALFSVTNWGPVIPPEDIPRLFDRFFRSDQSRTSDGTGGHGLGLAIARSTVTAHGGTISATSSEDEGTTFLVELPLLDVVL